MLRPAQPDASQRPHRSPSTSHVVEWAVFDPPCGRSSRGFLISPYGWRFTLFRYPLLFLSNGRFSRDNASLYRSDSAGPLQQQSSEDASARLVFLGDMMPTSTGRPPTADPSLVQLCSEADLVLMNCESPVSSGETARRGLSFNISPGFVADCLSNLGIDPRRAMFTVANNHAGDKGAEGIDDTVSNIEGLGATVLGSAVQGKGLLAKVRLRSINATIGIVSWSRWMNRNGVRRHFPVWRAEDVAAHDWAALREEHSIATLIGFPHWDFEQSYIPDQSTTILADHLVGEGAFDAVIGHGPHVCQPLQVFGGGGLCAYSIGNLCSTKGGWHTKMGMAFELGLNAEGKLTSYAAHPFIQRPEGRTNVIRLESFDANAPSPRDHRFVRRWRDLFPAPPRDASSLASAGDVLVFSARTMASRLTKAVTRSTYSHVAMIAPDRSGKLIVYEATKNSDKTPDATYGDEEYVGVHSFDIATRVRDFTGDCWLLRLEHPLSTRQVAALSAFCQQHLDKKTPFDYSQVVTAGIDDPFGIFESRADAERLFCSEFVCFALQEAGLFLGNPSEMTPLDVVKLPCFSTPLLVKRLMESPLSAFGVSRAEADAVLAKVLSSESRRCVSRRLHVSRVLFNAEPVGAMKHTAGSEYVDASGAVWLRQKWYHHLRWSSFRLLLPDRSVRRLQELGSSSVHVLRRNEVNGVIPEGAWLPGSYSFRDPFTAGRLAHWLWDILPKCFSWVLWCTRLGGPDAAITEQLRRHASGGDREVRVDRQR